MFKNLIIRSISRSLKMLPRPFKFRFSLLSIGIIVNSMLDVMGLAAILPLLATILKKGFIKENYYVSAIYNWLGYSSETDFAVFLCVIIVLFSITKNIFGIWIHKKQAQFCWDTHEDISKQILEVAFNKGYTYFTQNNSNQLLNKISGMPSLFAQQVVLQSLQFLNEAFILAIILLSLMVYDLQILFLLALILVPFFTIFYQANKRKVASYSQKIHELAPKIARPVYDIVFGYVDVVIGGVYSFFKGQYLNRIKEAKKIRTNLLVIQNMPTRLIEICVIMAVTTMLLYGLFVLKDVDQILTLLSVFGIAAYRTIPSINRLMLCTLNIKGHQYTIDAVESFILQGKSTQLEVLNNITFEKAIKTHDLCFSYDSVTGNTLKDINLVIAKGESIGIIGKSGSGKTTLMNIMLGFLEPSSGTLTIDDIPLSRANKLAWQKKIGYVRQDVFLIDGSLMDNVVFGVPKEKVDWAKFERAVNKARLRAFVDSLPDREYSQIGERGTKISGGQRQRIGIARALYHGVEVLFFDEATSALDNETESEITDAIKSLHDGTLTVIIIAHRKSTLKYCDRILKIEKGKLADAKVVA